jgi:hypothetical protein
MSSRPAAAFGSGPQAFDRNNTLLSTGTNVLARHPDDGYTKTAQVLRIHPNGDAEIQFHADGAKHRVDASALTQFLPTASGKSLWKTWKDRYIFNLNGMHHKIHNEVADHIVELEHEYEEALEMYHAAGRTPRNEENLKKCKYELYIAMLKLNNAKTLQNHLRQEQDTFEQTIKNHPEGMVYDERYKPVSLVNMEDMKKKMVEKESILDRMRDYESIKGAGSNTFLYNLDDRLHSADETLGHLNRSDQAYKVYNGIKGAYLYRSLDGRTPSFDHSVVESEHARYVDANRAFLHDHNQKNRSVINILGELKNLGSSHPTSRYRF